MIIMMSHGQFHGLTCLYIANACRMQAQGDPCYLPANSNSHIVYVNPRWQVFHSFSFWTFVHFKIYIILLVYFALPEIDVWNSMPLQLLRQILSRAEIAEHGLGFSMES